MAPRASRTVPSEILRQVASIQGRRLAPSEWGDAKAKGRAGGVTLRENDAYFVLAGRELVAVIERASGLVVHVRSLKPTPFDILPPRRGGLLPYFWNRETGEFAGGAQAGKARVIEGAFEGKRFLGLACDLAFGEPFAQQRAGLRARYRMFADRFEVRFEVEYLRDDARQFEVGITQAYGRADWNRHLYVDVGRSTRAWKMQERGFERYYKHPGDTTAPGPGEHMFRARLPYGILERDDRLLVWGNLDLNCFAVMSPNRMNGMPAFTMAPKGIKADGRSAFQFTYKVLPKPENQLADACRWYAENVYSTNRLTRGRVRLPKNHRPRVLEPGNVFCGFYSACWPEEHDAEKRTMRASAKRMGAVHLWYGGWFPWTEDHPTKGRWYVDGDFWQTAEGVRDEMRALQAEGFHVYFYVRQLRQTAAFYDDREPYKDWIFLTEQGYPWAYSMTASPTGQEQEPVPPKIRAAYGRDLSSDHTTCAHIDLCNDDARRWLTREIKQALAYYQPDGLAWDMGWGDILAAPCVRHPDTGLHHAVLRIQSDVYEWAKRRFPRMKHVQNESKGTPSHLYCDGIMFESGDHIDALAMESVKFYRTAVTGLYYQQIFPNAEWPQAVMRHLSYGVTMSGGGWLQNTEGTPFHELTALAAFSALCNATPLVVETGAVRVEPEGVSGSVWTNRERLLLALFNDRPTAADVSMRLDLRALRRYGVREIPPLRWTALSAQGVPTGAPAAVTSRRVADSLRLSGPLPPGHGLLAESP